MKQIKETMSEIDMLNQLPQYEEIELDESEIEEALRRGREEKFFRLQREAYRKKISEEVTYQKMTAEELFQSYALVFYQCKLCDGKGIDVDFENDVVQRHSECSDCKGTGIFWPDDKFKAQIKNLCCYFAKDPRSSYDLNKGLMITGPVGNGKSTLMKLFSVNQNHSFRVESMLDISFDYKMQGEAGTNPYCSNFKTAPNAFGGTEYGYCFDDVGTEEVPARHFAESKNIFAEILQMRYTNQHLIPFNSTHVTTNKQADELEKLYGSRCYDRMKEMFNLVVFEHGSFR